MPRNPSISIHTHPCRGHAGIAIVYPPTGSGTVYLTIDECRELASNLADIAASLDGVQVDGPTLARTVGTTGRVVEPSRE